MLNVQYIQYPTEVFFTNLSPIKTYFSRLLLILFVIQAIDAEKSKFDREMLLHGKDLTEEEFEKMMKQHQAEIVALEHNLNEEKEKQRKALEKKVCMDFGILLYM